MNKSRVVISVFLFLLLAACGGKSNDENDASVASDGEIDFDGHVSDGEVDDDGGETLCTPLGEECESTIECCGEATCELDEQGVKRCTDNPYCTPEGDECAKSTDCCSLVCDGVCQESGEMCKPEGEDCDNDVECCSDVCHPDTSTCEGIGSGCATLGEVCSVEGYDDLCCSKNCVNFGTESEPDLRCNRTSTCGARGEICSEAHDCCSGVCIDGLCPSQNELGGQRFAGEPCQKDSDCASYACASLYPGGPKYCQFLGGCRPAGEICSESWQCCSDVKLLDGGPGDFCSTEFEGTGCVPTGVEGVSVCDLQEGPKEVGEICKDTLGNDVHMCCPADACEQTVTGVWRCAGSEGTEECIEDGDPCQMSDQCCSGICAPWENAEGEIEMRCGPCVEAGGLCTTNSDCCGGICTDGICEEGESECVPLGGECTEPEDCCSGNCYEGSCTTIIVD